MKIVHSYWSKPGLTASVTDKNFGGWSEKKYFYYSWAFSCLKFREYYDDVELVTDKNGYRIFIELFQLPYTSVKVELDQLNDYHEKLWAIGKLYAYSIQEKPFLHVDGDVFIWEKIPSALENAALVAQHAEHNLPHYKDAFLDLKKYYKYIPEIILKDYTENRAIQASNAGVIGGNDLSFFKDFTKQAFDFIHANMSVLEHDNIYGGRFAILYEQYLFACLARKKKINVSYLFQNGTPNYDQLSYLGNKYGKSKFTHIIDTRKRLNSYCFELESMFRNEYPEYYRRIQNLLKKYPL